jgi:hypothetical protein
MNFNPFSQKRSLNMFDRTVGDRNNMGIFDYALAGVPALIKLGLDFGKRKSLPLAVTFGILSLPFSLVKLGMYIGLSPAIFAAWLIKQRVKKTIAKHVTSPGTALINQLAVKAPVKPGEDPDARPVQPLRKIKKLHDSDHKAYSIKAVDGELVLAKFPGDTVVAIFEKSRANIKIMHELIKDTHDENRARYWLYNVNGNIFNYTASHLINEINKSQASSHTMWIHKLLIEGRVDDPSRAGESFARINKDIRKLIVKDVLEEEVQNEASCNKYFASFTQQEREEAVSEYVISHRL